MRRALVVGAFAGALLVAGGGSARAHPLGNFTVSRFSRVVAERDAVTVHYVVDMAEIPTFQERALIDADADGRISATELDAYARRVAPRLRDGVSLSADGAPVDLEVASARARLSPGQGGLKVLRVDAAFIGELAEPEAELNYRDDNFSARLGWREIVATAKGGQGIVASSVPERSISHGLRSYPRDRLSSPPDVAVAKLSVRPGAVAASREAPGNGAGGGELDALAGAFASLVEARVSPGFLALALVVALGAGALHALGPGHGKTVMAAYLVGGGASVRNAMSIGVAVSLMHTASVVVLGLVTLWASKAFAPEAVYPWLSLAAGVVVLGLGAWLLAVRLRARRRAQHTARAQHGSLDVAFAVVATPEPALAMAERPAPSAPAPGALRSHKRFDDGHGEHHSAAHAHAHAHARDLHHHHGPPPGGPPLSSRGLAAVALSGGLLPSPSALVVLLGAVALHRIALGVFLVGAFSVGLAAALTGVGVLVIKARSIATMRLGAGLGALLPVLSAAAIVAVGLVLTGRALASL
jgi:nickel/cobalt exporter